MIDIDIDDGQVYYCSDSFNFCLPFRSLPLEIRQLVLEFTRSYVSSQRRLEIESLIDAFSSGLSRD